jgi:hypothetical protein
MEGFNMDDWEIFAEETDEDTGQTYLRLSYKHSQGEKHYNAYYWSSEEIYVEVWHNEGNGSYDFIEGGMTWSEALQYELPENQ